MSKRAEQQPVDEAELSDEELAQLDDPQAGKRPSRTHQFAVFIGEAGLAIVLALVLTALLRVFVFQIFQVPSGSMEHTLEQQDRIAAIRLADFERGDVVVFEDPPAQWMGPQPESSNPIRRFMEDLKLLPDSTQGYLVKRVIGMPGDRVTCCDQTGAITVNGVALDETEYLYTDASGNQVAPSDTPFDIVVPAGYIFVLGDHRDRSGDSRLHLCEPTADGVPPGMNGFVPIDGVVGPVEAIVLPFGRIGGFDTPATFANVPDPTEPAPTEPFVGEGSCAQR